MNRPPTYQEWLDQKNDGYWWIRFALIPDEDIWHTEIVQVYARLGKDTSLIGSKPLVGYGDLMGEFRLDDETTTKGMWWQPVAPHQ